ncbi:MAG: hypothetical protein Q4G16_12975 [Cruoricaptor ignavus]|nr:hypothetical protein [Cruoricaptor ignavus]
MSENVKLFIPKPFNRVYQNERTGFKLFLGKEKETIYRDFFTNRIYFQNGFGRTPIYLNENNTK